MPTPGFICLLKNPDRKFVLIVPPGIFYKVIKSICILRLSALGDVLMLVPLVQALKKQLPQAAITWIIAKPASELVEGLEGVEFIVIDKPGSLRDYLKFRNQFRQRHFDLLLATQACFRTNLLIPLISASRKIGFDKKRSKDGHGLFIRERIKPGMDHTLESFLKFGEHLGLIREKPVWDLPIQAENDAAISHLLSNKRLTILVNPAASKPERSWLVESYIQVINHLQQKWQAEVILTGGPSRHDRALADAILEKVKVVDLVGKTQPRQLLALIAKVNLVICPDTGPSHMAAAMYTPVIALHAVTNPAVSGPYGFLDLVVNYYPEALKKVLNKEVNAKTWGTHVHGNNTMDCIPVEAVIKKIDDTLGRQDALFLAKE